MKKCNWNVKVQKRAKTCRAMPIYNLQTSRVIIPQSCSDQTNFHFHITFTPFAHTVTLAFIPYTRPHSAATLPPKFWTQFRYPDQKAATGMGAHPTVWKTAIDPKTTARGCRIEQRRQRRNRCDWNWQVTWRNWCDVTDAVKLMRSRHIDGHPVTKIQNAH